MLAIGLMLFVAATSELKAIEINCEKIDRFARFAKCCFLNETTVISAFNVSFAGLENHEVQTILFDWNEKIEFLPIKVYKKFPNLEVYSAKFDLVKEISVLNFEQLSNLRLLDISWNQIGFIPDDCFQGLTKLYKINLAGNAIQTVNEVAFSNLPQLVEINLEGNDCINKLFEVEGDSIKFHRKVLRSCLSDNVVKTQLSCITLTACDEERGDTSCCELEYGTIIDDPDHTFVPDTNYTAVVDLVIKHQQNVEFLPVLIHERFPSLKKYYVVNTPVQKISKNNFEKLFKLKQLHLIRNQIEVIKSNTFEDLINLEEIQISNHRLNALNGQAFMKLHQLRLIHVDKNYCIDKFFFKEDIVTTALEEITYYCGFDEFDSVEIFCRGFDYFFGTKFCLMNKKTTINDTKFVIGELRDEEVGGISFDHNKKIEYLPYKVYMQFPNLVKYQAWNCSIKEITKENFEKLNRLQLIWLLSNKIQKIHGNTFHGLENLQNVDLKSNQIKSINGRTFDRLPSLRDIQLRDNKCIDDELKIDQSIRNFTRMIIQQCAFTETGEREFEKIFDIECGFGKGGSGFIVGGNEIKRGQWPFMVALIFEPKSQFFCGGNIITASLILTAAHCIQKKYQEKSLEANQIVILLGRHDISLRAEVGSEIRGVKEIKVHPFWNPHDRKYGGDIAVLEMDRPVQFSELIQPVCLTVEPEVSQREAGYVVGWGRSEPSDVYETKPRQVLLSSVSTDVCFDKDHKLGPMFTRGMFCAGGDGAGPCTGDSGGGFYVKYHGLWTLRGLVSSGTTRVQGGCNVDRYTLFTNILYFTLWIDYVAKNNASLAAKLDN